MVCSTPEACFKERVEENELSDHADSGAPDCDLLNHLGGKAFDVFSESEKFVDLEFLSPLCAQCSAGRRRSTMDFLG